LALSTLGTGCGHSISYSSSGAVRLAGDDASASLGLAVANIYDGRLRGAQSDLPLFTDNERTEDFTDLSESFREHVQNAGLIPEAGWMAAAPSTPEEARADLDEARSNGAKTILFTRLEGVFAEGALGLAPAIVMALSYLAVGLVPMLIVYSLPLNAEYAAAQVRMFVVDTQSGAVLATFSERASLDDRSVTTWGYDAAGEAPDVLFQAVEHGLAKAVQAARTGSGPGAGAVTFPDGLFQPVREPAAAGGTP